MDIVWDGITRAETLKDDAAQNRHALADAAKSYNWPRVFDLLSEAEELVNTVRHSARGKTITVLMHIWVPVPKTLASLRDDGLDLIRGTVGEGKLPVHWGMCLATYPFFQDVATITGRLLSLQTTVDLSQLIRRVEESWGARSTIPRAVQRVVRSLVDWGALTETAHRGTFQSCQPIPLPSKNGVGIWLIEAAILVMFRSVCKIV